MKPFEKRSGTFRNRFSGINSFNTNITNGFTEGETTKLRFLNVTLTVTKTSIVSKTVSYICFLQIPRFLQQSSRLTATALHFLFFCPNF